MKAREIFTVIGASIIITGCAYHEPRERAVVRHRTGRVVEEPAPPAPLIVSQRSPPTPIREVAPPAPAPGYVWSPGYWTWNREWMWSPGQWVRPPHQRAAYMPGRWVELNDRSWRYEPGYWR